MDYRPYIKRLRVPGGHSVPTRLEHGRIVATAIDRSDLADDVAGINASLGLIGRTRGGDWPTEPVTDEIDFVDLVWHELEFRDGYSYSYVLRDRDGDYLGCCYLYPLGRRSELTAELAQNHDVDVSWWVTPSAHAAGLYTETYIALQHWLNHDLPFWTPHYSNVELPPEATLDGDR